MRYRVTIDVEIDEAAWAREYGDEGASETIRQIKYDMGMWAYEMFHYPKWSLLARGIKTQVTRRRHAFQATIVSGPTDV